MTQTSRLALEVDSRDDGPKTVDRASREGFQSRFPLWFPPKVTICLVTPALSKTPYD